jgi:hypothetical protein
MCKVSFCFFFSNFCWATAIFILGSPALATGTKMLSVVYICIAIGDPVIIYNISNYQEDRVEILYIIH